MRWKWLVRIPLIGGLACILALLAAVPADAQRRRPPPRRPSPPPVRTPAPQVRDASPDVQRLSKGGAHKLITITGSHLERLTGGRLERPNGRPLSADVRLTGRRTSGRRVVRVRATGRTGTGNRLRLVLTTPRDRRGRVQEARVPVRIVVLDAVRIGRARAREDLEAGGAPVRYVIAGRGLGQLHRPRLERGGRTVPGTSVRFTGRNDRRATLVIRAGPDVAGGPADVVAGTVDRPMTIGPVTVVEPSPPSLATLTLDDATLPSGGRTGARVALDRPAREATTIDLTTTGPVDAPSAVRIPAGRRDASFTVSARTVGRTGEARVTAQLLGELRESRLVVEADPEVVVSRRVAVGRLELTLASPTEALVPKRIAVGRLDVILESPAGELAPKRIVVGRLELTLASP